MNRHNPPYTPILCYVAAFSALLFDWWLMKSGLDIGYTNAIGSVLKAVGDIALILSPYWLLSPRWRYSVLIPVWSVPLWCVVNLVYFRFWNDMIPPASVTMGGNVDSSLMEYGLSLLKWSDLWYAVVALVATLMIVYLRPGEAPSFRRRTKTMFIAVSLIAGALGQFSYFKTTYSWRCAISPRGLREGLRDQFVGGYTGQKQLHESNGMAYYFFRFAVEAIAILSDKKDLSEAERKEVGSFLSNYNHTRSGGVFPDTMNVVYIIVESLNADMIGKKIEGLPVMPTLDSIAGMEGTVVFDNVVSQIKAASSSDGHLLLMTGLLPPDKTAYSISYGSTNRFPSIADVLEKHNKYLLLADEGVCWNEGNTLSNFGLGNPLAIKDRPEWDPDVYGRDGAMFMQAAEMIENGAVRPPFMMTLMTISMHIPFKEKAWPLDADLEATSGLSRMEKDYVNMCRQTDRCIGAFLKILPENTVVFIASDHHQTIASDERSDTRAFFMAMNTGRTERVSRTVGQVNLFPATLEILGCSLSGYGGLAPSAFNPCVDGTVDSYGRIYGKPSRETLDSLETAYRMSDLIIRGDYFKGSGPVATGR